ADSRTVARAVCRAPRRVGNRERATCRLGGARCGTARQFAGLTLCNARWGRAMLAGGGHAPRAPCASRGRAVVSHAALAPQAAAWRGLPHLCIDRRRCVAREQYASEACAASCGLAGLASSLH